MSEGNFLMKLEVLDVDRFSGLTLMKMVLRGDTKWLEFTFPLQEGGIAIFNDACGVSSPGLLTNEAERNKKIDKIVEKKYEIPRARKNKVTKIKI